MKWVEIIGQPQWLLQPPRTYSNALNPDEAYEHSNISTSELRSLRYLAGYDLRAIEELAECQESK